MGNGRSGLESMRILFMYLASSKYGVVLEISMESNYKRESEKMLGFHSKSKSRYRVTTCQNKHSLKLKS